MPTGSLVSTADDPPAGLWLVIALVGTTGEHSMYSTWSVLFVSSRGGQVRGEHADRWWWLERRVAG